MNLSPVSNRNLTLLRKLQQKKYRYRERLFLLEGARAVEQVLKNKSVRLKALFYDESQQFWKQESWKETSRKYDSFKMSSELFAEVSDTESPQGVLAMCEMPKEIALRKLASQEGIIIALDAVQDPGNLGTIIRTATWFDVKGILSGKGTVDLFHPKVVRGTAGATGAISHINGVLGELLPELENAGWTVFILDAGKEVSPLSNITSVDKAIIVVGNEARGVNSGLVNDRRQKVCISSPASRTNVESLNAAVAASIALYDLSGKLRPVAAD